MSSSKKPHEKLSSKIANTILKIDNIYVWERKLRFSAPVFLPVAILLLTTIILSILLNIFDVSLSGGAIVAILIVPALIVFECAVILSDRKFNSEISRIKKIMSDQNKKNKKENSPKR